MDRVVRPGHIPTVPRLGTKTGEPVKHGTIPLPVSKKLDVSIYFNIMNILYDCIQNLHLLTIKVHKLNHMQNKQTTYMQYTQIYRHTFFYCFTMCIYALINIVKCIMKAFSPGRQARNKQFPHTGQMEEQLNNAL